MEDSICVENVHLFMNRAPFFQNVGFCMKKGRLHSLTGKNGSGKSTLLSILKGDHTNFSNVQGVVSFAEHRISLTMFKELQKKIILVPQKYDLYLADQFSFKENLAFMEFGIYPSPLKQMKIGVVLPKLLERFDIDIERPVYLLSGGQRQILSLLMAMQKNPELILLDEPTASLDPINAKMVFEFLLAIIDEKNLTCLVVCHDEELLQPFRTGSDFRISVLKCGARHVE